MCWRREVKEGVIEEMGMRCDTMYIRGHNEVRG